MEYSKEGIGKELRKELDKGYSVARISTWACDMLVTSRKNQSLELDDILRHLSLMDAGPEFEYTEKELNMLVELLINNEKEPIKKINDLNLNN